MSDHTDREAVRDPQPTTRASAEIGEVFEQASRYFQSYRNYVSYRIKRGIQEAKERRMRRQD